MAVLDGARWPGATRHPPAIEHYCHSPIQRKWKAIGDIGMARGGGVVPFCWIRPSNELGGGGRYDAMAFASGIGPQPYHRGPSAWTWQQAEARAEAAPSGGRRRSCTNTA